jgi:inosine-uridine nucleoside N-ribohydrolase
MKAAGNTPNKVSEWNFYADAKAVKLFFEHIEGVPVYMCGLEIADYHSVTREDQLTLSTCSISHKSTKFHNLIQSMQKLIQHSDFSCTFDPVAATVLLHESLYTFKEMKLKVETEPPVEARLRIAQEDDSEGIKR